MTARILSDEEHAELMEKRNKPLTRGQKKKLQENRRLAMQIEYKQSVLSDHIDEDSEALAIQRNCLDTLRKRQREILETEHDSWPAKITAAIPNQISINLFG